MPTRDDIVRMWDDHRKLRFPTRARDVEVGGVDLVLLDSLASGCISSYTTGDLDPTKVELLKELASQLRRVEPELDSSTTDYFAQLSALVTAVLASANQPSR
jgi:hypothetical protein